MNRDFKSIGSFARICARLGVEADVKLALGMEAVALNTRHEIREVMGDPNRLSPNAASTIAQKGKDAPLIDTGELRDSIEARSNGFESGVGTENIKMLWHEYGMGRNYPARPAMYTGAHDAAPENKTILNLAGQTVFGDSLAAGKLAAQIRKLK